MRVILIMKLEHVTLRYLSYQKAARSAELSRDNDEKRPEVVSETSS